MFNFGKKEHFGGDHILIVLVGKEGTGKTEIRDAFIKEYKFENMQRNIPSDMFREENKNYICVRDVEDVAKMKSLYGADRCLVVLIDAFPSDTEERLRKRKKSREEISYIMENESLKYGDISEVRLYEQCMHPFTEKVDIELINKKPKETTKLIMKAAKFYNKALQDFSYNTPQDRVDYQDGFDYYNPRSGAYREELKAFKGHLRLFPFLTPEYKTEFFLSKADYVNGHRDEMKHRRAKEISQYRREGRVTVGEGLDLIGSLNNIINPLSEKEKEEERKKSKKEWEIIWRKEHLLKHPEDATEEEKEEMRKQDEEYQKKQDRLAYLKEHISEISNEERWEVEDAEESKECDRGWQSNPYIRLKHKIQLLRRYKEGYHGYLEKYTKEQLEEDFALRQWSIDQQKSELGLSEYDDIALIPLLDKWGREQLKDSMTHEEFYGIILALKPDEIKKFHHTPNYEEKFPSYNCMKKEEFLDFLESIGIKDVKTRFGNRTQIEK